MESHGVMQDSITTTSSDSGFSQAFQRWKQEQSGTSTHFIPNPSPVHLSRTQNRDTFSLSYTTGEPPMIISDILKTTWWSGTTTNFSVIAKSWTIVSFSKSISTSSDFVPSGENLKYFRSAYWLLNDVLTQYEKLTGNRIKIQVYLGGLQLLVEVIPSGCFQVASGSNTNFIRQIILRRSQKSVVKIN
ncbi:hypothetical protein L6452_26267 [Arctium lappa]|uniref:Uncharacterized protein n=1 Tax=Arctium lappa TaxID=4217 RepID=A0ACB9ADD0_ARCLA|nr:hypothetical protein L6452_26267 [Arctium lappa]